MNFHRAFAITFFSQAATFAVGIANSIVIARALGPEGRGSYAVLTATIGLVSLICGGGLQWSNTYRVARDATQLSKIVGNFLVFWCGICTALWTGFMLLPSEILAPLFPGVPRSLVILSLVLISIAILSTYITASFLGLQNFKQYNLFPMVQVLLYFLFNLATFLARKLSVQFVMINWIVSSTIVLGYQWVVLLQTILPGKIKIGFAGLGEGLRIGGRALAVNLLGTLLFRSDIFLINYYLGAVAVGYYSIAVVVAELILRIPNIAGNILFPKVSQHLGTLAAVITAKLSRLTTLFAIIATLGLALCGRWLIVLAYGPQFAYSYYLLLWLLPGLVGMCIQVVLGNYYAGRGYHPVTVWSAAVALGANIGLNIVLVPAVGVAGAAVSSSVAYLLLFGINLLYFTVKNQVPLPDVICPRREDLRALRRSIQIIGGRVQCYRIS